MRKIPLTQEMYTIVDNKDYKYLSKEKWFAQYDPHTKSYRAVRSITVKGKKNQSRVLMHRLIMNTPDNLVCDHINHDTLDNRKSNLRNVSTSKNNLNKRIQSNNKLGTRGIYQKDYKYYVRIQINGKSKFLGVFTDLNLAIETRLKAEQEIMLSC